MVCPGLRHSGIALCVMAITVTSWADVVEPSPEVLSHVILRVRASGRSARIGTLRPGERLDLISLLPGWYEVRAPDGSAAFVSARWTRLVPTTPLTPSLPPAEPPGTTVGEINEAEGGLLAYMKNHPAVGNIPQWLSAIAALSALSLAVFSAWWAGRQWRTQYITEEWGKTVEFLFSNAQFLNPALNSDYRNKYSGDERQKYELVARRSIAYVDDLYHLRLRGQMKSWLRGAISVFVKPHLTWFRDNRDSYSEKFVNAVLAVCPVPAPPPPASTSTSNPDPDPGENRQS
jgi:hypothetical protein